MKRIVCILCVLCLLAGCDAQTVPAAPSASDTQTDPGQPATTQTTGTSVTATTTAHASVPKDLPPVDYDLTKMNRTMMYAEVYDMIYNPDTYLGKAVRICGPFDSYTDEETGETHRVILIRDATACCTQGIEFEPTDPDAVMPAPDEEMTVSGTFDTYMTGPFLYCVLRKASVE